MGAQCACMQSLHLSNGRCCHLILPYLTRHINPGANYHADQEQHTKVQCWLRMHAAGFESLHSLGTSHQQSRLTHLHTGSTTGPALSTNRSQTCSTVSEATSTEGVSPERQTLSASRQPTFPRGQKSSAGTTSSPTNSVDAREAFSSSGLAHLSIAANRQPMSRGLESSVTASSSAKPVGNADTGQVLSTSGEVHLLSAAAAEGGADSTQALSPKAATSSARLSMMPVRAQRALSRVQDKELLPSQLMNSASANRQMLSPSRDRGISPAKHTDLHKQIDALRFKLQVCFVCV